MPSVALAFILPMTERQNEIKELLLSLPEEHHEGISPASDEQIDKFKRTSERRGVDSNVIEQLADLYSVANNFMYEVILGFHSCTDDMIFEWWEDGELWIGQRDFNTLRWTNGKFCLGDAGNVSFSKENEHHSLIDLIKGCIKEIKELSND